MMKTVRVISGLTLSLFVSVTSIPASAQDMATPQITKRQIQQQKRIVQGERSGELTASESANLRLQEAKIQANKRAAKADGVVTDAERANLKAQENQVSERIYRKKHNERKAQ
jgi:hypothetical protein|nr:hypothetical protein [uncultured Undibacterium sp.]